MMHAGSFRAIDLAHTVKQALRLAKKATTLNPQILTKFKGPQIILAL